MKGLVTAPGLYIEIRQNVVKALNGEHGLELPLERRSDGRLTDDCKEKLVAGFQYLLQRKRWQPRLRAFCAIGARGVSLRPITLPAAARVEFQRLLLMQIEREFPLSPEGLAWGFQSLGETLHNGVKKRELLVMAIKKEVIEEYSEVLARCGIHPVFTLAALARGAVCPQREGNFAVLDIGSHSSEFAAFEGGIPTNLRVLPWGSDGRHITVEAMDSLVKLMNGHSTRSRLFLSGGGEDPTNFVLPLANLLGSGVECEPLKIAAGAGRSAAVMGLKKSAEENASRLLLFQSAQTPGRSDLNHPAPVKWAALAAVLAIALLLLPYAKAMVLKPWLANRLSALNSQTSRLDTINRELNFLQFLKQSQPPYLDAIYLFSKSAPSGSRIDSLTMNRRGEVSLRGSLRNSDQVAEFRTRLIDSGFFLSTAVEEQTPAPDRQSVTVRITALWRPAGALQALAIGATPEEIEKARNRKDAQPGMPPGFPPGGMPAARATPTDVVPDGSPPRVQTPPQRPPKVTPSGKEAKE